MSGDIDGPGPLRTLPPVESDESQSVRRVMTAGHRAAGAAADVPPPAPKMGGGMADTMGMAPPTLPAADLSVVLLEMQNKTQQTQVRISTEEVNSVKKEQAAEAKQRMDQLNNYFDKLAQSKNQSELSKIFGWIAAAILTVVGAVLTLAGGSGGPLLAAGAAMMTTMALQQTGAMNNMIKGLAQDIAQTFGCGAQTADIVATAIVGAAVAVVAAVGTAAGGPAVGAAMFSQFSSLLVSPDNLQAMGMSAGDAQKWSLGLTIGAMVAGAGAGLAGAVKSGISMAGELGSQILKDGFLTTLLSKIGGEAASLAGEDLGSEATEMADLSGDAAEAGDAAKSGDAATEASLDKADQAANVLQRYAKKIEIAARVGSAASNITAGAFAVDSATAQRDAGTAQADMKDTSALLMKLQQMFDDDADHIKKAVQAIQETTSVVTDILSGVNAANEKILTI